MPALTCSVSLICLYISPERVLHLPSVPLSVLLWLLAAGIDTAATRSSQILCPLLFSSSRVTPFFLFQCSLCMTRPTWRCTTSASPRSPSFSTAWSSNMSPWRHWRGIHPCIGTMKPSPSRRLYFWRRVCDAPVAFTQHFPPLWPDIRDIAKNSLLRWPVFMYWTCLGVFDAVIFFFGAYFLFDNTTFTSNGQVSLWESWDGDADTDRLCGVFDVSFRIYRGVFP